MSNSRETPAWTDDFPEIPETSVIFWPSLVFGFFCLLAGLYLILTPLPPLPEEVFTPRPVSRETPSPNPTVPPEGVLKFAFVDSEGSTFAFAAETIKRRFTEETKGKIRIELYPHGLYEGKKYGEKGLVELMRDNRIQMCLCSTSPLTSYSHDLDVLDLPFVFDDHAHAERVLDGEIGDYLLDSVRAETMQGLGYLEIGFRIFSSFKPMPDFESFKGKRIRVMQSTTSQRMIKGFHGIPVAAPVDKITDMAVQGTIDAADRTFPTYWDFGLYAVHRHLTNTRHTYSVKMVLINRDTYLSLSEQEQARLKRVVQEVAVLHRQRQRQTEEQVRQECEKRDIDIYELSPQERSRFVRSIEHLYKDSKLLPQIRQEGKV